MNSLSKQNINSFPAGTVPRVVCASVKSQWIIPKLSLTSASLNPTLLAEVRLFPCLLSLVPAPHRSCSGMSVSLPFLERQETNKRARNCLVLHSGSVVFLSASGFCRTLAKLICAIESHPKSLSVLHPSIFHPASSAPNITTLPGTALS